MTSLIVTNSNNRGSILAQRRIASRVRLFWFQTISINHFTPHRVFGYAWKIEFSGKAFHLTVK